MSESWDSVIIGAGVVGLAAAAELAEAGYCPLVLERHGGPGRETSSRNSEVIHAGIYYPTGSLKARLCVAGNRLLYDYCDRAKIPHRACGKIIVALDDDHENDLDTLYSRGLENGVEGLRRLSKAEMSKLEPALDAKSGLLSGTSGIVDSHELIKSLQARAQASGATLVFDRRLEGVQRTGDAFELTVGSRDVSDVVRTALLINAAGLEADRVSNWVGVDCPRLWWCQGDYFAVQGGPKLAHLVYPPPQSRLVGLGIHATIDLRGNVRLGPDAQYVERAEGGFEVDPGKAEQFFRAAAAFLPGLNKDQLRPDTYGIRPKLQGPDGPWEDFLIRRVEVAGGGTLINLLGIESPGLTAALAIGNYVTCLAEGSDG